MEITMGKITLNSKIKDFYATSLGRDLADKLLMQMGLPSGALTNPLVGNMTLKSVSKVASKVMDESLVGSLTELVNSEPDVPADGNGPITEAWWKDATFYQIYPRSFADSNGDGIGDLKGITGKLDYLKDLGVDCLWLSPIYDSPNDDNGYDIRDYDKIMTEFGTMEDFDELLGEVHKRGMRLIMDLVVNHTSDEHEWFKKAVSGNADYHDFYIFRKGDADKTPNNWRSFFAGEAWNYYPELGEWGLHLFSKKQMDLNWENPKVRQEVIAMVNRWLDKGVDGFRMDVINCISKREGLPDGNETIGDMVGVRGIENYFYGPHLHEYLREINEKAFEPHKAFSVGETPGLGMQSARLTTGEERGELNMIFSFDHLETPGHTRMEDYEYDLNYFRDYMIKWMTGYGNNCRMSLFYNNHDNPRMASKVTKNDLYIRDVQKLLAVMQFTLCGTPFIYQGDEMGLTNYDFTSMDQITDVEAKGFYKEYCEKMSPEEAFEIIKAGTREHARILLPWNENAADRPQLVESQSIDSEITELYRMLIALRRDSRTLRYGTFKLLNADRDRFVYSRCDVDTDVSKAKEGEEYIIDCNLSDTTERAYKTSGYQLIYPRTIEDSSKLRPYEVRIWKSL